jgi:D-xylose transport system substrate-binding protein
MFRKISRIIAPSLAVVMTASMFAGMSPVQAQAKVKVGLSFSDFATERWPTENKLMTALLTAKGYDVVSQQANQDPKLQNDQIETMITQGVKAIIVIAQDGDAAVTAVDDAAKAGVKVIAYDRLIKSTNIAAYLSFNNTAVGNAQSQGVLTALGIKSVTDTGKWTKASPVKLVKLGGSKTDNNAILFRQGQDEVLQPYVDAGIIKIVGDQFVENWDPANAVKDMENILTAQNNAVDAVVASNDGTALGALQALNAQKLAGIVPISGQDATAAGCNSIVKGQLTVTIFKDTRLLSPLAVDLADNLIQGKTVADMKSYTLAELTNDKTKTGKVSAVFLPVVQVTKDNVYDVVVKSGFQSYDDVYKDIAADKLPPRPAAATMAATMAPMAATMAATASK